MDHYLGFSSFQAAVQTGVLAGADHGADTQQQASGETSSTTGSTVTTFQNTRFSLYSVRGYMFDSFVLFFVVVFINLNSLRCLENTFALASDSDGVRSVNNNFFLSLFCSIKDISTMNLCISLSVARLINYLQLFVCCLIKQHNLGSLARPQHLEL